MKKILFILLILTPSLIFSKKVINSGHQSTVKFIEYLESEDAFFSISEDGTLVIKKTSDTKIYKRVFLTDSSISAMTISPKNNQLAIVESNNSTTFTISVWDWKKERKLYSINLKEYPMNIGFSGNGSYLFTTSISKNPVNVFNAKSGALSTYLNKIDNFVDYVYIGSSEKYAFLYSSSGTLNIRRLSDSKLIKTFTTEKNLTNLDITADKRYLIGSNNNKLYLIGRNDGKKYSSIDIPNLKSFRINKTTGEVICFIDNRYKKTFRILQVVGGSFFDTIAEDILIGSTITAMSSTSDNIIYSTQNGDLYKYNRWDKKFSLFLENNIVNIEGITIIEDTGVILTKDKIYLFKSPFFTDKSKNSRRLTDFTLTNLDSPIISPRGSTGYKGNLLIWNQSIAYFDITTGETIFNIPMESDIIDVKVDETQLLVLDNSGLVKIIDLDNSRVIFTFKSSGFTSIGFYSESEIIGGIDSSQGGSLMILDTNRKETLPLTTSLDIVFDIIHSKNPDIIYISGLKRTSTGNNTYFIEYNIFTKQEKIILKRDLEVFDSSFAIDEKNTIFTNLGTQSLLKINGVTRKITPFQSTTNQTKTVYYNNNGVYTINENRSLSIWHPGTRKKMLDFYLFKDDEWVTISQDNTTAFGSPNSKKYIGSN
ncbi:MAG: hypothetical protein B6229_03880 [Spirochaetaceae bacterium 4572_7]|nr:MAG: hypothetical protein B6229_03880 [Spirochaetaceae bacterium 4572_7]